MLFQCNTFKVSTEVQDGRCASSPILEMYGNNTISHAWELYKKSQHALWIARTLRAKEKASCIWVRNELWQAFPPKKAHVQFDKWKRVERLCREKAKEYE